MSKLLYNIFVINGSDPANPSYETAKVRLSYIGGATGIAKGRIYKTGDAPPAFAPIVGTFQVAADEGETYEVEFQDDAVTKHLATVNVHEWVGGCFADHITINWLNIYRFSGKVQVSWYGSMSIGVSIDDGVTFKNTTWNGTNFSAEWSNAELALLGYVDLIPNIKTRRTYLQNQKSVISFADPMDVDWPAMGFTRVNLANTIGFSVSDTGTFQGSVNYVSGTIVEVGSDYVIIQHSYVPSPTAGVVFGIQTSCVTETLDDYFIGELVIAPFVLTESHTDVTVNAGGDGSITPQIVGGSGTFTYAWDDGPTILNRVGLSAGTYTLTVTDTITAQEESITIVINEPAAVITEGTFLRVPFMNSIPFVERTYGQDENDNPQALDNRLLCEQYHEGYDQTNYFNKVVKTETIPFQFESDFSDFILELFKYSDTPGAAVKTVAYEMKEQNIGVPQDFGISIRNNISLAGTSRVYFQAGPIPIPLQVGGSFTIFNNADGFDGNYTIVDILNDFTLGYQYLVINKLYAIVPTSSLAQGRFFIDNADFNVFESIFLNTEVPDGDYYYKLEALLNDGTRSGHYWVSEPVSFANLWKGTSLIEYRCKDNSFGITWTTGFIGRLRVESHFGTERPTGGERSTTRNANYSIVKVNAKKSRIVIFKTFNLPPYKHEQLSVAFDCDEYSINKVRMQSTDAYGEANYPDQYLLGSSSIKVEQKDWFGSYNSDDIGTVNDGGFLLQDQGYLKL